MTAQAESESDEYTPVPCGTYGAYQRHKRNGEDPCAACRKASRDYARKYRERVGPDRDRAYSDARNRAVARLIKLHPGQFKILVDEERDR